MRRPALIRELGISRMEYLEICAEADRNRRRGRGFLRGVVRFLVSGVLFYVFWIIVSAVLFLAFGFPGAVYGFLAIVVASPIISIMLPRKRIHPAVLEELRTRGHNVCPECGYLRTGLEDTVPCPECGTMLADE